MTGRDVLLPHDTFDDTDEDRKEMRIIRWTAGSLCLCMSAFAVVQTSGDKPEPSPPPGTVLKQLFPKPTGLNGYEDLVLAGEYARNSAALEALQQKPGYGTLSEKRRVLDDPPAARALSLLRKGLTKPITSPHVTMDENTLLPEFALFRNLARLLMIEQYVLLADGKVGQAIDNLRDGMRLGYYIQSGSLISGLVGVAVDAIVIARLALHLDQLSARDCDRLVSLANDWMKMPDPLIAVMAAERDSMLRIWDKYRDDPKAMLQTVGPPEDESEEDPEEKRQNEAFQALAKDNPVAYRRMMDQSRRRMQAHFDALLENLRRPAWERKEIPEVKGDSLADRLAEMLLPSFSLVGERYAREQAQVQLLGVHAAIRRYRWEHERLPESLDALRLGRLALDPFTGQPLVYKRPTDTTYDLYSAGPYDRGNDERPPSGQRVPIYVPRRK